MVERVEHTLARESRAMLGADLVVASNKDLLEAGALDSMTAVLPADTQYAHVRATTTMVRSPLTARPVQLETLPLAYPFAGVLRCEDEHGQPIAQPAELLQRENVVLVQPDLLPLMQFEVGDTFSIGTQTVRIAGTVVERPGQTAFWAISGPLVLCGDHVLDASELLGLGARVRQRILLV